MAKEQIKLKMVAQYNGHSFKKNGDLDLNFKLDYSEIVNVVSLIRMLNQNIKIMAKVGRSNPEELGEFIIRSVGIDRDGESKVKFSSETDDVNAEKLIDLMKPETLIVLQLKATIESDEEEESDDDDE